jgi:DNA-directed RNA polymerase subunit RPC12/RpoP
MVKYNCEQCGKEFSQKSHYDYHNRQKTPCENKSDKIKQLVVEEKKEKLLLDDNLPTQIQFIDLFAGTGAFSLALEKK